MDLKFGSFVISFTDFWPFLTYFVKFSSELRSFENYVKQYFAFFAFFVKFDKSVHRMVKNLPILKNFSCRDIYFLWGIWIYNQKLSSIFCLVAAKRKKMYVRFFSLKKHFFVWFGLSGAPQIFFGFPKWPIFVEN